MLRLSLKLEREHYLASGWFAQALVLTDSSHIPLLCVVPGCRA